MERLGGVLVLALALVSTACVRGVWIPPAGRSEADFRQDRYECRREAMALRPPVPASPVYLPPQEPLPATRGAGGAALAFMQGWERGSAQRAAEAATRQAEREQEELYRLCMEARGYRWERRPPSP